MSPAVETGSVKRKVKANINQKVLQNRRRFYLIKLNTNFVNVFLRICQCDFNTDLMCTEVGIRPFVGTTRSERETTNWVFCASWDWDLPISLMWHRIESGCFWTFCLFYFIAIQYIYIYIYSRMGLILNQFDVVFVKKGFNLTMLINNIVINKRASCGSLGIRKHIWQSIYRFKPFKKLNLWNFVNLYLLLHEFLSCC